MQHIFTIFLLLTFGFIREEEYNSLGYIQGLLTLRNLFYIINLFLHGNLRASAHLHFATIIIFFFTTLQYKFFPFL